MGRSLKELREAKGWSYEDLAHRINRNILLRVEGSLRAGGGDMRNPQLRRARDQAIARWCVDSTIVERWEKVGFGVQDKTRAAREFYDSLTYKALVKVMYERVTTSFSTLAFTSGFSLTSCQKVLK